MQPINRVVLRRAGGNEGMQPGSVPLASALNLSSAMREIHLSLSEARLFLRDSSVSSERGPAGRHGPGQGLTGDTIRALDAKDNSTRVHCDLRWLQVSEKHVPLETAGTC